MKDTVFKKTFTFTTDHQWFNIHILLDIYNRPLVQFKLLLPHCMAVPIDHITVFASPSIRLYICLSIRPVHPSNSKTKRNKTKNLS